MISEGVDQQVAKDWLTVRKAKRLPLTPTAWEETKTEAEKAGMTVAEAVRTAVKNSWGGFRASWLERPDAQRLRSNELPWHETRSGIEAKGAELGFGKWDQAAFETGQGEPFSTYCRRVYQAAGYEPARAVA